MFIGNEYLCDDLFKMNVIIIISNNNNNNKISSFSNLLKSCGVWHDELGYMDYNSM